MEALGIDIKLLIAQLVNFGLFSFLIAKFVVKPFKKFMKEQTDLENEKEKLLKDISSSKEDAEKLILDARENARKKAEEIIADAKVSAEVVKNDLIVKAKEEAHSIITSASKQSHDDQRKIMSEVKIHIIENAKILAQKALSQSLNKDDQEKLVAHAIKSIESLSKN